MGQPKSKSSGPIANRVAVLVDRREGYAKKIGVREIATTHNCNSLGNSQPSIENGRKAPSAIGSLKEKMPSGRAYISTSSHMAMLSMLANSWCGNDCK